MDRIIQISGRKIRLLFVTRDGSARQKLVVDELQELETREEHQVFAHGFGQPAPDVLLLDAKLPEGSWRDLLGMASAPAIILGSAHLDDHIIPCLIAGARGHVSDEGVPCQLREAVETVLLGHIYAGPALVSKLFSHLALLTKRSPVPPAGEPPAVDLSIAETRVLNLIARGLSNQGIADSLGVSRHTVANHVHSLLKKLNAKHRGEAVALAARENSRA